MTFKEYIEVLQRFLDKHPEAKDMEAISGPIREYEPIVMIEPLSANRIGYYNYSYLEFTPKKRMGSEHIDSHGQPTKCNAVMVN